MSRKTMARGVPRHLTVLALVALLAVLYNAAPSGAAASRATTGPAGQVSVKAVNGYTKGLPPSVAKLYPHAGDPLGPSAYEHWKAEKSPWTLCFNNSYLGNTWRAAALSEFNTLAAQYQKAGLVRKYLSTNSNLNLPEQIQQMRDMITVDHCSGIITIPTGTSGMDGVIKEAYQAGIPVVTDLGATTTPDAENFDENWYASGAAEMQDLARAMHGKGNLLYVVGIPGETIDIEYKAGVDSVLTRYPKIHLIGYATGQVTDSIAEGAVLTFLSTHTQKITGVFQEGGMGAGIVDAFKQEKRPLPALVFVGSGSMVSIFHTALKTGEKPNFYGLTDPPGWTMEQSFNLLARILEGQHPKNMTVYYTPPAITPANVNSWWKPSFTSSTTAWPEPPTNPMRASVMDRYFFNGKAPLPYQGHR